MVAHEAFDVEIERSRTGAVLIVRGDLDIATVGELERAREQALADGASTLLIDLGAVGFVDSSGLRLLLQTYSLAQRDGWKLELLGPGQTARAVFAATGADRQLPFIDSAVERTEAVGDDAHDLTPVEPRTLGIEIDPSLKAPQAARTAVRGLLADDLLAAEQLETLTLLVSEIVTNTAIHPGETAEGAIEFSVVVTPGLTRVVVTDGGPGFETPAQRCPPSYSPGGYGIFLLDSEASRWGTLRGPGRFSVWFELDHAPAG